MSWNVILKKLNNNTIIDSKNNPNKSGNYLCTCVNQNNNGTFNKYLFVLSYDDAKNNWHDVGNEFGISHTILAWKDVEPCDFSDFTYEAGFVFEN